MRSTSFSEKDWFDKLFYIKYKFFRIFNACTLKLWEVHRTPLHTLVKSTRATSFKSAIVLLHYSHSWSIGFVNDSEV